MNFTKGQQENDNENFKAVDSITQNSVYNGGFNYRAICHFQSVLEQIFGAVVRRSGKYRNASLFDNWHFAHEMRMGYARYYVQSDIRTLAGLNVGEAQSAMQNELKEISDYMSEQLFSLMKQFGTFAMTVLFLLWINFKLAMLSIVPVIPLIFYCSFSSKVIKKYTQQCQYSRKKLNGLADMILELFPVIQIYDACKLIQGAVKENLSEWGNASIKKEQTSARLMSFSGVLSFVPLLLLLGFGGAMVIQEEISLGTFYIFINLSGNVSGFLQNMPGIYAGFRRFSASVDRLEGKLWFHTQFS